MPVREKRSVLRSLFSPGSKKYWNLKTEHARLLFLVLLTNADDFGRLEGAPEDVKSLIPRSDWDIKSITTYIVDLKRCGLVLHYKANGEWYIEVVDFWENQDRHGVTQIPSKFPPATGTVVSEHQDGVQENSNGVPRISEKVSYPSTNPIPSYPDKRESEGDYDFRSFHKIWKAITHRVPKATKANVDAFNAACGQYGIARVLAAVKPWASEQNQDYLKRPDSSAPWKFLTEGVHDYMDEEPKPEKVYPRLDR
jgi:hypothetical protein